MPTNSIMSIESLIVIIAAEDVTDCCPCSCTSFPSSSSSSNKDDNGGVVGMGVVGIFVGLLLLLVIFDTILSTGMNDDVLVLAVVPGTLVGIDVVGCNVVFGDDGGDDGGVVFDGVTVVCTGDTTVGSINVGIVVVGSIVVGSPVGFAVVGFIVGKFVDIVGFIDG